MPDIAFEDISPVTPRDIHKLHTAAILAYSRRRASALERIAVAYFIFT